MKMLTRDQAFELWDQWWCEMESEWFNIEVLQDYSGEDSGPSLSAWLNSDKEKSIKLMSGEMKQLVEMCQKSTATKRRFRIVQKPLIPYTEWEIELYKQVNIPLAGEQVQLVPAEEVEHLQIPDGDVMIFDQKRVARAYYNSKGKVEKMDFYDETDDITKFLELREELSKHTLPVTSANEK
ncbi:MAG: hypothetical protein HYZ63_02425 [Candidatus Andersenbacteria bacterium]|nr:hypothetical protein [Candidatus Andersenbacteria bacterium]